MFHSRAMTVFARRQRSRLRVLCGALGLALSWPLSAALPLPADPGPVLRIHGSNTVGAQLAPRLIAGLFESQGLTHVRITPARQDNEQRITAQDAQGREIYATVAAHGSGTGFSALREEQADLAASSRPIKADELEALKGFGDLSSARAEQVIAIDGLAIITHPDNPLRALTLSQVAALFAGEIRNWAALGGPDLPVRVHARDDHSGTFDTFKELVLSARDKPLRAEAVRYESNDRLSEAVAADRGAIGFVGLASVGQARAMAIADGDAQPMLPETALVATEDYPLSRRLFLYARPDRRTPWVKALIEHAQSEAGQATVAKVGYVPQQVEAIRLQVSPGMPGPYRRLVEGAQRLTVNFRFAEGSAQLDNKALRDIDRVTAYLEKQGKLEQHAVLVGFGDTKADPARAELLSKLRAMAVRRELAKRGVVFKEINGLGDELPVASNLGDTGRNRNRRVEVWVY